jgi:hypothetical protein
MTLIPITSHVIEKGFCLPLLNDFFDKIQKMDGFIRFSEEAEIMFKTEFVEAKNYEPESYRSDYAMSIIIGLKNLDWVYEIRRNNINTKYKIIAEAFDGISTIFCSEVEE